VIVFTVVKKGTLEKALDYLACPKDRGQLELDAANSELVSDGEYRCTECGSVYEIRNGVPYFFEKANGYEWEANTKNDEIADILGKTFEDKDLSWSKIITLPNFFLSRNLDRKKAIDYIFDTVKKAIESNGIRGQEQAFLMQAATAARYDIEVYRGTFLLPDKIISYLSADKARKGIVVEGACATGDCLRQVENEVSSDFYLGLDISGSMARNAQRNAGKNMLFVQGDICSLPLKDSVSGAYVLNNVFDRVTDPAKACKEADRISLDAGSYFCLSNCNPLQFEYQTDDGQKIVFVPCQNRLSLEEGMKLAGFNTAQRVEGIWKIETVAFGKEALPYIGLLGKR